MSTACAIASTRSPITCASSHPTVDERYTKPEFETDWHDVLLDLGISALTSGITNTLTVGSGRGEIFGAWKGLGIEQQGHNLGHMKQPDNPIWIKIRQYNSRMLVKMMEAMESVPEGSGTMMDHTLIVYTSNNADKQHTNGANWPVMLLGELRRCIQDRLLYATRRQASHQRAVCDDPASRRAQLRPLQYERQAGQEVRRRYRPAQGTAGMNKVSCALAAMLSWGLLSVASGETYTPGQKINKDFAAASLEPFLASHCVDCHGLKEPAGNLSLHELGPVDEVNSGIWKRVWAQVTLKEMPPKEASSQRSCIGCSSQTGSWVNCRASCETRAGSVPTSIRTRPTSSITTCCSGRCPMASSSHRHHLRHASGE